MGSLTKLKIRGSENVPAEGAFVLTPNHFSEIDPLVIGIAMWKVGRMPRYLAKASVFKVPIIGWLLRRSGQIPVERSGSGRGADPIKAARAIAANGRAVVVYPEGTLTRDPNLWPMRGKSGAVRIALQENLPIIPVAHWGTQKLMPRYARRISLFPRKKIDILFGEPVDLSAFAGRTLDSSVYAEATDSVMNAITALLEELRAESAPASRWDPAEHDQKETGRFEQR